MLILDFTKNSQAKTFKTHFNTNTLWNLEFAVFDFTKYKTLVHRARFPYLLPPGLKGLSINPQ